MSITARPAENNEPWGLEDTGPRPSPAFTTAIDAALQTLVQELDYDLHKSILVDEETEENGYPALASAFGKTLAEGGFGKLPAPWNPASLSIETDGWLVEESGGCTCAGGTIDSNYAHEQHCGTNPIINLTQALKVSGFTPVVLSEPAAIKAAATAFLATPGDQPEKEREQEWAEYMMGPALTAAAPFYAAQAKIEVLLAEAAIMDERVKSFSTVCTDPDKHDPEGIIRFQALVDEARSGALRLRNRAEDIAKGISL